ncbi:callose synthase 7-like [Olea europaea subsp. europaea]|uniref:Callose synthase 7-like n=1 Tax=Olea europaea subsp. europaea TaxID=158383 RepID=A0A8S0TMJ2_OLEEU|nr:callose synthase 7-like [Olea europaea subsp. europaea]
MNVRDPYKRLGISREASEDEIQAARNFLILTYGGHKPSMDAIESAHDKIIMQKFYERKNPKINIKKKVREVTQSPIVQAVVSRFRTPSTNIIIKTSIAFAVLGVLTVLFPTEEGPTLQVAISLLVTMYFIYDRLKSKLRGFLYGAGTFVISWLLGTFLMVSVTDQKYYDNIKNLMLQYPSLRVAYIDEKEKTVDGKTEKDYYFVLVKGGDNLDEEIYRIKLPGNPIAIGGGKPENQNHAIIFTRGEALQTIDMNQDNYFEEAFKMRNVLEEFLKSDHGQRRPTILGLREHIFTGSVSSLAWFMSNQETSFVTIGQRVLANLLRVRFHYGHPDIFDRIFHLTRGGISKASKAVNLSEDIFSGYNSTLQNGYVTHHEYIQVGKRRDVCMNQISQFEAKVANGNGEQTLSRDVYRLGHRFDFYRMLSFYFTTVGFYFSSMVSVLTIYVFLYGRLYMVLSGLERRILEEPTIQSKALEEALVAPSFFQLGFLLVTL